MIITLKQIMMSECGSAGQNFLHHIYARHGGLVKPFVDKNPQLAADWVAVAPHKRVQQASAEILVDLFGEAGVQDMQKALCMSREEIVRVADKLLYKTVQMASPSGIRVSHSAAVRLDRNLANMFSAPY